MPRFSVARLPGLDLIAFRAIERLHQREMFLATLILQSAIVPALRNSVLRKIVKTRSWVPLGIVAVLAL